MSILRYVLLVFFLLSTTLWASVGKVALLKGEAVLERGIQKLTLHNGALLEENDIIKTSKDAQIQLVFEDKTIITLGEKSELKIEEYLNNTTNPKAKFKFNQGAFKTITGKIGKVAPENFKMETKTATIGIRGTIAAGTIPPPLPPEMPPLPESFFCLGGTITITPFLMPDTIVIVPTGSFTQVLTPSSPPTPPVVFLPSDVERLNQGLGMLPPPEGTPPQKDTIPPTPTPSIPTTTPIAQSFVPPTAEDALTTNIENTLVEQIQNQICPEGTTGTYPECTSSLPSTSGLKGRFTSQYGLYDIKDGSIDAVVILDSTFTQGTLYSPWNNGSTIDLNNTKASVVSGSTGENIYWGKWTSTSSDTFNYLPANITPTEHNFWVAGKYRNEASSYTQSYRIYDSTAINAYSYNGKVLGAMYNGLTYQDILPNDPTNSVLLTFLFGKGGTGLDSSKSYITFTVGGTLWELYFSASSIANDGNFGLNVNTLGYSGVVKGDFYGLSAQNVGGEFFASQVGVTGKAYGVFIANEMSTATTLSLTGFNAFEGLYGDHSSMGLTLFENNTSSFGSLQKFDGITNVLISLFDASASLTYTNDHNFTLMTDSATLYSIALAGGASNDYARWGTWIDANEYEGFWVAGKDAALAARYISEKAGSAETYSYSGKVLGKAGVYDGASHSYQDIVPNDPTNKVVLTFDFGSEIALDTSRSYVSFTPVGGTLWQLYFGSYFDDYDRDRFQAYFGGEYSGGLGLQFYGDAAQSIGGGFSACKNDSCSDNDVAYGVFIGNQMTTSPLFVLSGLSTSTYDTNGTSISDPILMEATDSQILAKTVLMYENNNSTRGSASGFYSLDGNAVVSSIHDFNNTKIWTEIDTSPSNDYVSWGYWVSTDEDGGAKLKAGTNYWVAGKDAAAAAAFIENLPSTNPTPYYIYTGKVLGSVIDNGVESAIDTASSSVQLKFQFGGGVKSFYNDSVGMQYNWIRFTDASSQLWDLRPTLTTPNVTGGKFSDNLSGTIATPLVPTNVTGAIIGQFFGNTAQAVGGTFKASDTTQTLKAIGVFKAIQ